MIYVAEIIFYKTGNQLPVLNIYLCQNRQRPD